MTRSRIALVCAALLAGACGGSIAPVELDASTDYGEVQADLPGTLGGSKGDETHKLHGTVGGGGPKLRLHSSSGDVEIATH